MFKLAMQAQLPLLHVVTDDTLHVEEVISFIADRQAKMIELPEALPKGPLNLNVTEGGLYYTSSELKAGMAKLYRHCADKDVTIVFVNTEKSVLHFDGGSLFPPQEMIHKWLMDTLSLTKEDADALLPSYGGLTLKDVAEVSKLTMTRDETLTPRGVNETRRGYIGKLRGIEQVDTKLNFYVCPPPLQSWLKKNREFFVHPTHPALIPRGLLADGPPGTGKTLASKHIAAAFGIPLYRLDIGGMMGKYVGESETNVSAALAQIDQVAPCVVIFDEMEKIFQQSGDGGVTTRVLSQLLWWLQEHKSRVFVVMTTNKVAAIPEELYRPGRIDQTLQFLGLESKKEGVDFALEAFHVLAKELGHTVVKNDELRVRAKVENMFDGSGAVPQGRITQAVLDVTKSLLTEEKGEGK